MKHAGILRITNTYLEYYYAFLESYYGSFLPNDIAWNIVKNAYPSHLVIITNETRNHMFFYVNNKKNLSYILPITGLRLLYCFVNDILYFSCGTKRIVSDTRVFTICHDYRGMILRKNFLI